MNSRKRKFLIWSAVAIVVTAGVTGFFIYDNNLRSKTPGEQIPEEIAQRSALMGVIDAANRNSGIESGAVFSYEFAERKNNATNFGILLCRDEVRCDSVVSKEVAVWRQSNSPSDDTAEIDTQTHHVVSFHRDIPDFAANGNYGEEELESRVRQFLAEVYPDFANIESNLTFDPGMKGVRLNNGNYFYRWNDEQFALPTGLSMDIPPFVQVGVNTGGFIFSYTNTLPLYQKPIRHDLQTLCGYVEMPPTDDSSISPEEKIVKVRFDEYEPVHQGRYLLLPYEPEIDFEGCSESAKEFLRHLPNPYDKN